MNDLIVIKQLPVIEERLKQIKEDVTSRIEKALSLVCTEETLQTVKKERAALNKESNEWEEKRKAVKTAIMSPYEQFETVYKDCISDAFKTADEQLKAKIDSIEAAIKDKKRTEVESYFYEYMKSKSLILEEFITYERANINITLSASLKRLKEQIKEFIDRVCDDVNLIGTQEDKDEILFEYKKTLNVSSSITTVAERHQSIDSAKSKEAEHQERASAERVAEEKVQEIIDTPLAPPKESEQERIIPVRFTVYVPEVLLKDFKKHITEYFKKEGFRYE